MNAPILLNDRIASLLPDIGEDLRSELHNALRTLRDVGNVPAVMVSASRIIEGHRGLLGVIASAYSHNLRGGNLNAQIEELRQAGVIPQEIASDLHWVRIRANQARHNSEKTNLTLNDAETALDRTLSVIEWIYCKAERGPQLPTIYTAEGALPLTAQATVTQMLEAFLRAQKTTDSQLKQQQSELEQLRSQLIILSEQRKNVLERVVGSVPSSVIHHFKDRVDILRSLRECLYKEHIHLVFVCGRAGIGKTSLITKLIDELKHDIASEEGSNIHGSIVYIALRQSEFRSPDKIIELICRVVEPQAAEELRSKWREETSLADKLDFLFMHTLGKRRCLIVLDNFEDILDENNYVLEEFSALREFIEKCLEYEHGARIVATSRRTLVLPAQSEGRFALRRMELPLDEGLPEDEAVTLLRELDADGRLGVNSLGEKSLREVVRSSYGIPRTLETIIGTLRQRRTLTLARLIEDKESFARLIANPAQELYENLSPAARLILQTLAVYKRPVPAAAVRHMLPASPVDYILDSLVRDYIVQYDNDTFSLHPLDQEYAYNKIPEGDGEYAKSSMHKRAAGFYREIHLPQARWRTIEDIEPQLEGAHHLIEAGDFDQAAMLYDEVDSHLWDWGHFRGIISMRTQLIGKLTSSSLDMNNYEKLSSACSGLGNYRAALDKLKTALEIANNLDDAEKISKFLCEMGRVYLNLGWYRNGQEVCEQALAKSEVCGDKKGEADALLMLAIAIEFKIAEGVSPKLQPEELRERAVNALHAIGDQESECKALIELGNMYLKREQREEAVISWEKALNISRQLQNTKLERKILRYLGRGTLNADYIKQEIIIQKETRNRKGEARALVNLGEIYKKQKEHDEAISRYMMALSIYQEIGDKSGEASALSALSELYFDKADVIKGVECAIESIILHVEIGQYKWAYLCLSILKSRCILAENSDNTPGNSVAVNQIPERILVKHHEMGDKRTEGEVLNFIGMAISRETPSDALKYFERAVIANSKFGEKDALVNSYTGLGDIYRDTKQYPKALEHFTLALSLSREISSKDSEVDILGKIALVHQAQDDLQSAQEYYHLALEIVRQIGGKNVEAWYLQKLGGVYGEMGELIKAVEFFEQSAALYDVVNDKAGERLSLVFAGNEYKYLGDVSKSSECLTRSLELARQRGDKKEEAYSLKYLGDLFCGIGDYQKANRLIMDSLGIFRDINERQGEEWSLNGLGWVEILSGNFEQAITFLQESLIIDRELNATESMASNLDAMGQAYGYLGELVKARQCYEESVSLKHKFVRSSYVYLGLHNLIEGNLEKAEDHLSEAIALYRAYSSKKALRRDGLFTYALALLSKGLSDQAIATYKQALSICHEQGHVRLALYDVRLFKDCIRQVAGLADVEMLLMNALA